MEDKLKYLREFTDDLRRLHSCFLMSIEFTPVQHTLHFSSTKIGEDFNPRLDVACRFALKIESKEFEGHGKQYQSAMIWGKLLNCIVVDTLLEGRDLILRFDSGVIVCISPLEMERMEPYLYYGSGIFPMTW